MGYRINLFIDWIFCKIIIIVSVLHNYMIFKMSMYFNINIDNFQMYLKQLYTNIIKKESWNYYGLEIADLDISNSESCRNFIKEYIQLSGKSKHAL